MKQEPQQEHRWLEKLVGEWTFESACDMGPDQPAMKMSGTERVRSLGGLWVVAEQEGESPDGTATAIMTLGYDPPTGRFVGSFIVSVMAHFWIYNGSLDAGATTLRLDTEGPGFTGDGMSKYQDVIEFVTDDERILSSHVLGADGQYQRFMQMHYRRTR